MMGCIHYKVVLIYRTSASPKKMVNNIERFKKGFSNANFLVEQELKVKNGPIEIFPYHRLPDLKAYAIHDIIQEAHECVIVFQEITTGFT